jgi:hypothetical protein
LRELGWNQHGVAAACGVRLDCIPTYCDEEKAFFYSLRVCFDVSLYRLYKLLHVLVRVVVGAELSKKSVCECGKQEKLSTRTTP